MFRRTLTILSSLGLLLSVALWGVSYLNIWAAGDRTIVWGRNGTVAWSTNHLALRAQYAALQQAMIDRLDIGGSLSWENERYGAKAGKRYLASIPARNTSGVRGFAGLKTNWTPAWERPELVFNNRNALYRVIPLWIPAAICSVLPMVKFRAMRRRRERERIGLCAKCSYDLRGSKDRCPECGTGFSRQDTAGISVPPLEKLPR